MVNEPLIKSLGFQGYDIMSPEQKILIDFLQTNYSIVKVEPLHYIGLTTGTEFLTYSANKLYLAFSIGIMNVQEAADIAALAFITLRKNSTTSAGQLGQIVPVFDNTLGSTQYVRNQHIINNVYFCNIVANIAAPFLFTGYRLTIV